MATYKGDSCSISSSNSSSSGDGILDASSSSDESSTSAHDFQLGCSSMQLGDCDSVAAVQRRRRMRRVQIMREKRARSRNGQHLPPLNLLPLPRSFGGSCHTADDIHDPKVIRKLKNRESAARSRQRKDEMLDGLTYQLCEYYVTLSDLQSEQQRLVSMLPGMMAWAPEALPFAPPEFMGSPFASDESDIVSDMTSCSSNCSSPLHPCLYGPDVSEPVMADASLAFPPFSPEEEDVVCDMDSLDWC